MHVTKRPHTEELELNMTPMIDIVFQLLIFFLVVTELATYDRIEHLTLPLASEATPEEMMHNRLIISVDTFNRIFVMGRERSIEEVEAILRVEKRLLGAGEKRTTQPILIQADRYAQWQIVQDILEKAAPLGFYKFSFSAKREAT